MYCLGPRPVISLLQNEMLNLILCNCLIIIFFFKKGHSQRGHTCLTIAKTRNSWEYLGGEVVRLILCMRAFAGRTRNTVPACEGDSGLVTLMRAWGFGFEVSSLHAREWTL